MSPMSVLKLVGTSVLEGRLVDHPVVDEKVATSQVERRGLPERTDEEPERHGVGLTHLGENTAIGPYAAHSPRAHQVGLKGVERLQSLQRRAGRDDGPRGEPQTLRQVVTRVLPGR